MKVCDVDGCDRQPVARGWCKLHWQRWRRHGDPTMLVGPGHNRRRDAWTHGSRRGFEAGCRCFPCRRANNVYHVKHRDGWRSRVPAGEVAEHLERLIASGWTQVGIAEEAGTAKTTPWHILNGRVKSVNRRTAEALFAVEPLPGRITLDAGPLVDAIRARGVPISRLLGDPSDRRAFHRAAESGTVSDDVADRLSIRALRLTLEELYGPDWDRQVAA